MPVRPLTKMELLEQAERLERLVERVRQEFPHLENPAPSAVKRAAEFRKQAETAPDYTPVKRKADSTE